MSNDETEGRDGDEANAEVEQSAGEAESSGAASTEADESAEAATPPEASDPEATAAGDEPSSEADEPDLAHALLHEPVASDDKPHRRWAYPGWLQVIATLFILYHGVILLVHNLPSKGLAKGVQKLINDKLHANRYWRASGNTQSWAMFAPNPHRSNIFMKVMVKDENGEVWDLKHDIYGKRSYPYLWYDRMGKINRRIVDQKGYRRHYTAWVCREWEKAHDGESAVEVQFIKMWTRIPSPKEVIKRSKGNILRMGYDPMKLHLHQREEDTVRCKTTRHAQLPNYLRERYGIEPAPERHFKDLHMRTWWDQKEAKAKQAENEARRLERMEKRKGRLGSGGAKP
ncbi:MAG: hypothetical protein AAF799_38585 [Myxococcota bacterium]